MPVEANREPEASGVVVNIEILGQPYKVRSNLDTNYVDELAAYVDQKMQTASEQTAGADSLRIAVLAALNIADDYLKLKQHSPNIGTKTANQVTLNLEKLVDEALASSST